MKIKIIGDSGVGKTALVNSLVSGQYNEGVSPLVGVSDTAVEHGGGTFKLRVQDTGAQERYRRIVGGSEYYGINGVAIVFDTTDLQSFNNVKQWLAEVERQAPQMVGRVIVGTKSDLTSERAVDFNTAKEFADSLGIKYVETSAKNHTHVEDVFKAVIDDALVQDPGLLEKSPHLRVTTPAPAASQPQKAAASAAPPKAQIPKTTASAAPPTAPAAQSKPRPAQAKAESDWTDMAPQHTAPTAPTRAQTTKTQATAAPPTAQATQSRPQPAQTRAPTQPMKPAPQPPTTAPAAPPTAMEQYVSNMRNTSRDTGVEIDGNTARSLFDVGYHENLYALTSIDLGYNRSFSGRDVSTLIMTLSRDKIVWNEFLDLAREHQGNVNSFLRTFIITNDRSDYTQALHNLPSSAIADLFSRAKEEFESSMKKPQESAQPATQHHDDALSQAKQGATAPQQATPQKTELSSLDRAKQTIISILSIQQVSKHGFRDTMSAKMEVSRFNKELKGLQKKEPSVVEQAYLEVAIESLKEIEKAKQAPKSIVPTHRDSGRIAQLSISHPQIVEQAYLKVAIEWLKEIEKAKQAPTQDIAAVRLYSSSVARLQVSHPQIIDKAMEAVHSSKPAPQAPGRK